VDTIYYGAEGIYDTVATGPEDCRG